MTAQQPPPVLRKAAALPLYQRVERQLHAAVTAGEYGRGQKLPNERQLAADHGVSRVTLRQALQRLCDRGVLHRIPGQGMFVPGGIGMGHGADGQYLCVLSLGAMARFDTFASAVMSQVELSAQAVGRRAWFRYMPDVADLEKLIQEVDQDPAVLGGVLTGRVRPETMAPLMARARKPWVRIGDFLEPDRSTPVMDYVTLDNYLLGQMACDFLVEREARRFALFALDERKLVSRDQISAYRTTLGVAGVPAAYQQIFDMSLAELASHITPDAFDAHVKQHVRQAFDYWRRSGHWPDGLIIPGGIIGPFEHCLHEHPSVRKRLASAQVVVWEFDERRKMAMHRVTQPNVTWLLTSLRPAADRAVERLREPWPRERPYVCDFVRRAWFESNDAAAPAAEAHLLEVT